MNRRKVARDEHRSSGRNDENVIRNGNEPACLRA